MPDPNGRYAALCTQFPYLKSTKVAIPDVRDMNGKLIHPSEYQTKLHAHHLKPVFVEVYLRVYVTFYFLDSMSNCPYRWEISRRSGRANAGSYNDNGSRIYQLLLKRMELLPNNTPVKNIINPDSKSRHTPDFKGKKRASSPNQQYNSDSDGPSSSKRVRNDSVEISTTGSTGSLNDDVIMKDT